MGSAQCFPFALSWGQTKRETIYKMGEQVQNGQLSIHVFIGGESSEERNVIVILNPWLDSIITTQNSSKGSFVLNYLGERHHFWRDFYLSFRLLSSHLKQVYYGLTKSTSQVEPRDAIFTAQLRPRTIWLLGMLIRTRGRALYLEALHCKRNRL